ncbi:DUF3427 domain-containing protein [Paenibacillus sp. SYP-B3998]|uniref:DUF3427 domain-containing protein n=1 Tax=Paenibacillus sp. SYP-B3998 TaxID=2678564 RepID=A0A6G4A4X5_9BACL|nr:DUF3427 domain-containing protein [Paenibacillus sp. SYP-B3998]NEW09380.1 DUF3427 domain-containing protein [Paenibacillus sp. SYP-B3998]
MSEHKGVFEEILHKNKEYPANQITYNLLPQNHNHALIQQVMKDISKTFKQLADQNQQAQILELTHQLRAMIPNLPSYELDMPLKAIHYRNDDHTLPMYPELFLSHPLLLTNSVSDPMHLLKALKYELLTADNAYFMVSFVRWSGLQLLIRALDDLRIEDPTKKVKILTSTYLKITEPKALRRLLELPNVETKVFDSGRVSFHTKAYMFERKSSLNTVIIGSSNLSFSALKTGHEWNVKLPGDTYYSIYENAKKTFDMYWADIKAKQLNVELIDAYEKEYNNKKIMLVNPYLAAHHVDMADSFNDLTDNAQEITPNIMQQAALDALEQTRLNGHNKGVVIAATGTGKTYLSAFDVRKFGAKKVLFLAHRDEILESSKKTFSKVLNNAELCGKLTGAEKEWDKPYLFSTVQTLSRDDVLNRFNEDYFDYIVVDEFHHAEATTYKKVINHFNPKFLLGLTATPDRMDGRDVLTLCDNNVVYEIRLRDALREGLLTPFRYFGLSDSTIDYNQIELQSNGQFVEKELVRALNNNERVDYIISMINKFGYDGRMMMGLGFCASIEHARYMCEEFNARGYSSAYLTGKDSPEERQKVIARLEDESNPLQIVFTVNIFNEGVDIPKVNLILFLRPTESATIFIQQLGRGLRKVAGKEYVTILDFIGNYQKSFIVPLALSDQHNHKAFDRDSLRIAIETEFADLPDGCFVDLEEVSRKEILKKIENIRMDRDLLLMDLYNQFKRELGYSPELNDFLYFDGAPSVHFFIKKYGSWVETKKKMQDLNSFDKQLLENKQMLEVIRRIENMLPLKWPYGFSVLAKLIEKGIITREDVISDLSYRFALPIAEDVHGSKIDKAMEKLSIHLPKQNWSFGKLENGKFISSDTIKQINEDGQLLSYITERIEYGLAEFRRFYRPDVFFESQKNVVKYQNYTRNDLIYLFESPAKEGTWREGVSRVGDHYLLFINLNKGGTVADHLQYHDYFVDQQHFHWQSQNPTSHDSERGQEFIHHVVKGRHIHLFVRKFEKMHNVALPFTYLGEADYVNSHGDKPMNINWRLHQPIPDALYTDFIR